MMNSRIQSLLLAGSALVISAALFGAGDPPAKPTERPALREGRSGDPATDRKALHERLTRHLADTKKLEERLQSALDRLDKGESSETVLKDMESTRGERTESRTDAKEPPKALTPDEKAQMLVFLREHLPRAAARLEPTAEQPSEVADRVLTRFAPKVREVMGLKQTDPKLFTFRVDEMRASFDVLGDARDLTSAIREKKDATTIASLEESIKAAVGRRFDAQLAAQRLELETLGGRMEQLKTEIDHKSASRDASVAEEAARIVDRARKFDSNSPRHNRSGQERPASEPGSKK